MKEFIPILIPILIFSLPLLVATLIICIRNWYYRIQYMKYLDSIKVGDVFYYNYDIKYNLPKNPFDEVYIGYIYMHIRDIKKNDKGETWVKYDEYRKLKWGSESDFVFRGVKEAGINEFVSTRSRLKDIGTRIKIN